MSLAYRQIEGGGAACVRTAACFNATPKQPLLMSPASSTCGSPGPPPRAVGPSSPPLHPPARGAATGAAPPGTRLVQPGPGLKGAETGRNK